MSYNTQVSVYGWEAVPRSFSKSLSKVDKEKPAQLLVTEVKLPESDIAKRTHAFAKQQLPEKTFNHSMRVVYFGYAIVQTHFPHFSPLLETYYLTCLLHDLGTIAENMHGSHMSFEYYGAFKAMNFLIENGAPKDQAEAVSEAIIRHADLGETGTLTSLGMLVQLSTVFGTESIIVMANGLEFSDLHLPEVYIIRVQQLWPANFASRLCKKARTRKCNVAVTNAMSPEMPGAQYSGGIGSLTHRDQAVYPKDNVGLNPSLVSASTIESVVAAYPRKQWSCCFADAMNQEMELKPWCHTTANEGFVESVLGNKLMEPYDG